MRRALLCLCVAALGIGAVTTVPESAATARGSRRSGVTTTAADVTATTEYGFVPTWYQQARADDYLAFATTQLVPNSPTNVLANAERARRDPSFHFDSDAVTPAALQSIWDQIDGFHDTSDFSMLYLMNLWYGYRTDLRSDLVDAMEQRFLAFKYWYTDPQPDGVIDDRYYWSENHRIIYNTLEFLAGQAFPGETFTNDGRTGAQHEATARQRILDWINEKIEFGFTEWHSDVYYQKDLDPLLTLVEFSDDAVVARRAEMLLDLFLLDIAQHVRDGNFGVTHGRSYMKDKSKATDEDTYNATKELFDTSSEDYASIEDPAAVMFARATKYRLPTAIWQIARTKRTTIDQEHMGVALDPESPVVANPTAPAGHAFSDPNAVPFWWERGAQTAWQVVASTISTLDQYGLWSSQFYSPFQALRDVVGSDMDLARTLAQGLSPQLSFGLLSAVDTYTYRSPDVMLSTAQDYRPGMHGEQHHISQATLDNNAIVFTTSPKNEPKPTVHWPDDDGYFTGNGALPRAAQHGTVSMSLYAPKYTPNPLLPSSLGYIDKTHAYFPQERFDEVRQVGNWTFGRRRNGYVALWSWRSVHWQSWDPAVYWAHGLTQPYDLVADGGADNVWITEVGDAAHNGTFDDFVNATSSAPILVAPLAANDGLPGGFDVAYASPTQGVVTFGSASSTQLKVGGTAVALHGTKRLDSSFVSAAVGAHRYDVDTGAAHLTLNFDTNTRTAVARPTVGPAWAVTPLGTDATDCARWRYGAADEPADGVLPSEFDRSNYKRTSLRSSDPAIANSPHQQCGQEGIAADLAWGVTKGRPDTRIAVLDSGIKWRDVTEMRDLATKAYINLGEAVPPCGTDNGGDCNGDGRFDITDFGAIADLNGNGLADPEDLILDPAYNNGVDDDHDGYVDDVSGWDFLYGDNDPLDTVRYGHGTGEAGDSNSAENGYGDVGTCPKCTFVPVRVGDSFVADGGRFAAGVLFALDTGASVVQEALGVISNPSAAQSAIDLAYNRGVVVVASMADEASKHPNLPAALRHTLAVNSVTKRQSPLGGPVEGYLALNGCTNYGGRTIVSVESGACSSEATGIASGVVGLVVSEARDRGLTLSAAEIMQIVRATADDIDFSTPTAVDEANDFGTSDGSLLDTVRYPTAPGWDATHGYGRMNAYEAVRAVRDERIPPTADIVSPNWFSVLPTKGTMRVRGTVDAPRADSYDYRLEWTPGFQHPKLPATDRWYLAGVGRDLHEPVDGLLGTIDLAEVAAKLPGGGSGAPTGSDGRPDEERFAVRLRLVVVAHGGQSDGLAAIDQRHVSVHNDPDLVPGYPRRVAGAGTASPVFAQLDANPGKELVLATDNGDVHVYGADGRERPGFPVRTATPAWWPTNSPSAAAAGIAAPGAGIGVGGPAIADLDGDGTREIVVTSTDGAVWAWEPNGALRSGFPQRVNPNYSLDTPGPHDQYNRTKPGFVASPALGDLDGDGKLDIVAASTDRHVYAWHDDGTTVSGFPVLVVDPTKVSAVDATTHAVTFAGNSGVREGGELIVTPALGDLDGDGHPDIVVGAQEEYAEALNLGDGLDVQALLGAIGTPGNSRVYAISSKGTNADEPHGATANPDAGAYLPGWPTKVAMLTLEALPSIGDGVSTQAAIGDVVTAHPGPEVLVASAAGPLYAFDAAGESALGSTSAGDLPFAWSAGLGGASRSRFGARSNTTDLIATVLLFSGPAIGHLDRNASADVSAPAAGLKRVLDIQASDFQPPADDMLSGWSGRSGNQFTGLPHTTPDMAFFVTPAIADIDGDGRNETIAGNGVSTLTAVNADGQDPSGWPKLTGGWLVGTPGLGDWDGDGRLELATVRRDGVLQVWRTRATTTAGGWARFGGNDRNTGRFGR